MAAAFVLPSDWICACVMLRIDASATEHTKETASDHRTVTISVSTGRIAPHAPGATPRLTLVSALSRAPLGARELLLLLLQVLRDGARALDGELLDLAVRGPR